MKLMKYILPLMLMLPLLSQGQCRSYTKKKCLPDLDGYVQNDNYNSARLIPGDEAELLLTFYGGKEYRLLICSMPILGPVDFEVYDDTEELIYSSATSEDRGTGYFDFKVSSTQQLMIKLIVPEDEGVSSVTPNEGCVTIMVGSKEG